MNENKTFLSCDSTMASQCGFISKEALLEQGAGDLTENKNPTKAAKCNALFEF